MDEYEIEHINRALRIINQLIPLADRAQEQLKGARNWGIVDILGGGRFTSFMKHSKIENASPVMNQINALTRQLNNELRSVAVPTDFSPGVSTFAKFTDIFSRDIFIDVYVQSKVSSNLKQIRRLQDKLKDLRVELNRMKSSP